MVFLMQVEDMSIQEQQKYIKMFEGKTPNVSSEVVKDIHFMENLKNHFSVSKCIASYTENLVSMVIAPSFI